MELHHDFAPDPDNPSRCKIEQLERLLGCFQKALGHEFANQLVALQGLARLLVEEQSDRLDEEGRSLLLHVADLARRADGLARALADMGRVLRDPGPAEAVALPDVALEAAAEVNLLFPGWSVAYHFSREAAVLPVSRRSLRLVLVHLLRNAVQAGGGRRVPLDVGSRRTTEGVEWWVKDDGRGLTDTEQSNLFECFAGGTAGLGLFLVHQIVAAWGGAVTVESAPGEGTTFTVLVRTP
jgi:signal transduction histidine kinase